MAKRLIPPTRNPYSEGNEKEVKTAVRNSTKDAAASPTDSFPFTASFFFANAYLYLFAIVSSPYMITDKKGQIPQSRSQRIQDQIIHVKTADSHDQLQNFHAETQREAGKDDQKSASELFEYHRQDKTKGNKSHYISQNICEKSKCAQLFPIYPESPDFHKRIQIVAVGTFLLHDPSISL
jgi:hypothetical protein